MSDPDHISTSEEIKAWLANNKEPAIAVFLIGLTVGFFVGCIVMQMVRA